MTRNGTRLTGVSMVIVYACCLAVWVCLNLGPSFLLPQVGAKAEGFLFNGVQDHLPLLFFLAIACPLLEYFLFTILLALMRSTRFSQTIMWPIRTVICTFILGYLILILLSWASVTSGGSFLSVHDSGMVLLLFDVKAISSAVTASDITRGVLLVGGAVVLLIFLQLSSRALLSFGLIGPGSVCAAILLLSIVSIGNTLGQAPLDTRIDEKAILEQLLTPQTALISALINWRIESYQQVALAARPAHDLNSYKHLPGLKNRTEKDILIVVVEALRHDIVNLSVNDRPVVPTIRRLAQSGTYFSRGYAQSAETGPAMKAVVSGVYPLSSDTRELSFNRDFAHARIYELLSLAGYKTGYFTSTEWRYVQRFTDSPFLDIKVNGEELLVEPLQKFAPVAEKLYDMDVKVLDRVRSWIDSLDPDARFFSFIYFASSHFPYNLRDYSQNPLFTEKELELDTSRISFFQYPVALKDTVWRRYLASLHAVDALIGNLISFLTETGRLDNTIIVLTGDHGEYFGEHGLVSHGRQIYEPEVRVPLLFWEAHPQLAPSSNSYPVGHIDIAPSILTLLNLPAYEGFQGVSLFEDTGRQLRSEAELLARPLFSIIQSFAIEDSVILGNLRATKNHKTNRTRLFNLENDPEEQHNLAGIDSKNFDTLSTLLSEFRNRQLTYYNSPKKYRIGNFPPRPPDADR